MSVYVLVHGGGHGGWCWSRVAPILRGAGHDVHTPTLTGLGERVHLLGPEVDLDLHVTDVVNVLEYEDLAEVVLVGHSYGCMVITGVADRAADRIGQLVYLDGPKPRDGESLADVGPGLMALARSDARVVDGVELVCWPGSPTVAYLGVEDPDDLAWVESKLTPQPWKAFGQPLRLADEAAIDRIPRTNINCVPTLARMQDPTQRERRLTADRVWEIDTGHDAMVTAPGALAELLLRLASA